MSQNERTTPSTDIEASESELEGIETSKDERSEVEGALDEAESALQELSNELQQMVQEIFNVEGDAALQSLQQSITEIKGEMKVLQDKIAELKSRKESLDQQKTEAAGTAETSVVGTNTETATSETVMTAEDALTTLNEDPQWQKIMDWRWDKRALTDEEVSTALDIVATLHEQPENYSSTELRLLQRAVTNEAMRDQAMEALKKYGVPRFENAKQKFTESVKDQKFPTSPEYHAAYAYNSKEYMNKVYGFNNAIESMVNDYVDMKTHQLRKENVDADPQDLQQQRETWRQEAYQLYGELFDEEAKELVNGLQQIKGEGGAFITTNPNHSAREAATHLAENMKKAGRDTSALLSESKRVIQEGYDTAKQKNHIRTRDEVYDIEGSLKRIDDLMTS